MSAKKHIIALTDEERETLKSYVRSGVHSARFLNRVRVLLRADKGQGDPEIARQVGVSKVTAYNIRRRFATKGLQAALKEQSRSGAPRTLTGPDKANVVLLACTDARDGRTRWTHRLLADKLVELDMIPAISYKSVERILQKNELKPWQKKQWCIRAITSGFLMRMEDILDLYALPYDPEYPVICLDERPCQLLGDTLVPIPMKPGKCYTYDHHYERHGVYHLFIAVEPLTGFRFAQVRKHRTKEDYAEFMKAFMSLRRYATVTQFRCVQDNLNIHSAGSFYQAFAPDEAHALKQNIDYHYTPTNGSWLNMAELELSAISRHCLDRRIATPDVLEHEILACIKERNAHAVKITWQFTTSDAREKLCRHYEAVRNTRPSSQLAGGETDSLNSALL